MTNLKNKLSASVRQAKASTQPPSPSVASSTRGRVARLKKAPDPAPDQAPDPSTPAQTKQALASPGFDFPSRVWPD